MNTIRSFFLLCFCLPVCLAAQADEFSDRLVQRFPDTKDAKIARAFPGFYSVVKGSEILFVNDDLSILITGNVVDLKSNQSLTSKLRAENQTKIKIADLDLNDAIRIGLGSRRLYVFADPDCPYCQQLETELSKVKDAEIYIFMLPLEGLHPNAHQISESIWCSPDKQSAWRAYLLSRVTPVSATCPNPLSRNTELSKKSHIFGTPALVFEDGSIIPGAVSAERIESQLLIAKNK